MSGQPASCGATECPSFERIVQLFLSKRYARVLDEYCSTLEEYPDYLAYHSQSTALKLQFQLKLNDLPLLSIRKCVNERSGECCIVDALKEAISRRLSDGSGSGSVASSDELRGRTVRAVASSKKVRDDR